MKILKKSLAVFVAIGLSLLMLLLVFDEDLPQGVPGEAAENLADRMLEATNHQSWKETGAITWNFDGRQQHLWDRRRHLARVTWKDHVVLIDINRRLGKVMESSETLSPEEEAALCLTAWKFWANDSYWLNPISKIRDPGTSRSLVELEGETGLLVTYNEGGVTPGDSYLWFVDENGLPYKWKMWVKIIPIGGISTTWESWEELTTGIKISTLHKNGLSLQIMDLRAAKNIDDLADEDVFQPLTSAGATLVHF